MKRFNNIITFILVAAMLCCMMFSCNNSDANTDDDVNSEAIREVEELFNAYFKDLNDKNFSSIAKYYSSGTNTETMIASLEFNSSMFDITYELDSVVATFVDDGNIGATVDFKQTSKNLNNPSRVTVTMEHHTYLITNENGTYVIKSMAVGEGDVISNS